MTAAWWLRSCRFHRTKVRNWAVHHNVQCVLQAELQQQDSNAGDMVVAGAF